MVTDFGQLCSDVIVRVLSRAVSPGCLGCCLHSWFSCCLRERFTGFHRQIYKTGKVKEIVVCSLTSSQTVSIASRQTHFVFCAAFSRVFGCRLVLAKAERKAVRLAAVMCLLLVGYVAVLLFVFWSDWRDDFCFHLTDTLSMVKGHNYFMYKT